MTACHRPGIVLQLLQPQRDLVRRGIDLQDLDIQFIAGFHQIARFAHARIGHIGDMQQPIDAAQIDKSAEIHHGANTAMHHRALFESRKSFLAAPRLLLFEHDAPVDDHILFFYIQLRNPALDLLPDQVRHLVGIACAATGRGHEGADADIHAEPAFHLLRDNAPNVPLLLKSRLESGPIFRTRHFDGGQFVVAFAISRTDGNRHLRTDMRRIGLGFCPLGRRTRALYLPANIHHNGLRTHGHNRPRNRFAVRSVGGVLLFEI